MDTRAPAGQATDPHIVRTLEQLGSLFGPVAEASLKKEVPYVHPHYRALIAASPFVLLATSGPDGLDVSPRGDKPGFVAVQDDRTLLLPERRGNNRTDSLHNLLSDDRVGLLFLIPGVGETLRVNGRAAISIAPDLLERFSVDGHLPKCVLVISVDTVFFQCAKAIRRSNLWQPAVEQPLPEVPTSGVILEALSGGDIEATKYDRELPERLRTTLY